MKLSFIKVELWWSFVGAHRCGLATSFKSIFLPKNFGYQVKNLILSTDICYETDAKTSCLMLLILVIVCKLIPNK